MLAAVRWGAVLIGTGSGLLAATLLALALWLPLEWVGAPDPPQLALLGGVLAGLLVAGLASGRGAPIQPRFHGSLAGLGMAAVVLVVARLGGSPAPTGSVLVLALLAVLLGGLGGTVAGRSAS